MTLIRANGDAMADGIERAPGASLLEAAVVARRYYLDRRQKSEIATELGVSRFKVARLLDLAHAAGLVHITVDVPADVDLPLSDRLVARFGMRRAIVVRGTTPDGETAMDGATLLPVVGVAAARFLAETLRADETVGVSWGAGVGAVVDAIEGARAAAVVQLVGGVRPTPLGSRSPTRPSRSGRDIVQALAGRLGAEAVPLDGPLLLESARTAALLRRDPSVAETIARFGDVTTALVGIGSWSPPSSSLVEAVTGEERRALVREGAVADVCGIVLGGDGRAVRSALPDRMIGIDATALGAVRNVVAVASGIDKAAAVAACLRSGLVDVLVTDAATAARVLAIGEADSPGAR
ncbi:sugar-binding transcriptional regulator [Labedella endophytica]|uniref:Transcriptional regulator n=1 Tax=Labedella endophytica TaxID=1523160 RepID=A0A3S1CSU0_9MICO|nr:sugar-binding domain-containing protein [Labedella endophytica]RUR01666.1 transcriptional regulator [Labedella endophytica]